MENGKAQNPRAREEHLRNTFEHGFRLNYAGKYVPKQDPEMFWINGSFGVREVPYLWDQWAKIRCPILEMKGTESNFLSPEILDRMKRAPARHAARRGARVGPRHIRRQPGVSHQ